MYISLKMYLRLVYWSLCVVLLLTTISHSVAELACPTRYSDGALISKVGKVLKRHVRKTLANKSYIQCSLQCQHQDWCISINFEISKSIGKCELNDFGVPDELSTEREDFERREGFIYIQLRPAVVSFHMQSLLVRWFNILYFSDIKKYKRHLNTNQDVC